MALLQHSDVLAIRRISSTINADRFNAFAKEAEDVHLRLLLGDQLYLDLIDNPTDAKYVTLLNGESYTNLANEKIKYFGLRVYLAYAWLFINTVEGDEFQTNVGQMTMNQPSFTMNNNNAGRTKSNTGAKYQDSMIIYKNNIIDYLNEKQSIYPLWKGNTKDKRGKFIFDII